MKCPRCGDARLDCKDSRPVAYINAVRRRRLCAGCGLRFTTFEMIPERELEGLHPYSVFQLAHNILDGKEGRLVW
jgi:transcriptional regulator NrdR family protein